MSVCIVTILGKTVMYVFGKRRKMLTSRWFSGRGVNFRKANRCTFPCAISPADDEVVVHDSCQVPTATPSHSRERPNKGVLPDVSACAGSYLTLDSTIGRRAGIDAPPELAQAVLEGVFWCRWVVKATSNTPNGMSLLCLTFGFQG